MLNKNIYNFYSEHVIQQLYSVCFGFVFVLVFLTKLFLVRF